jgi:hypothetical protein
MIGSADEFRRLRTSDDVDEQRRASLEPADEGVWGEIIERFPDLRQWVAHNKTIPLGILRTLAADLDPEVRSAVASKRKLDRELFELLAQDPEPSVRCRVAWNRKTPADVLAKLAGDPEAFVVRAISERA